jgi:hypothetical protein
MLLVAGCLSLIHASQSVDGLHRAIQKLFSPIICNNNDENKKTLQINTLNPKFAEIIVKNSVRTAKKTQPVTITKISWSMLLR